MSRGYLISAIATISLITPTIVLAAGDGVKPHRTVATDGTAKLSVSVDKSVAQVADTIQFVVEFEAPQARGSRCRNCRDNGANS